MLLMAEPVLWRNDLASTVALPVLALREEKRPAAAGGNRIILTAAVARFLFNASAACQVLHTDNTF